MSKRKEEYVQVLEQLSEEERKLLNAVIEAERKRLYMRKPHGIYDDLWSAIKECIK